MQSHPRPARVCDMQQKSLAATNEFVGHQLDSRQENFVHYANIRHNNGVQLNEQGNL